MPKKGKKRIEITLDLIFKRRCSNFFERYGCEVHTEKELITGPKRIDALVISEKGLPVPEGIRIFDYFVEHNLISYKSFNDNFSLKDIYDCKIYYYSYLWTESHKADRRNTSITLIASKMPEKVLEEYKEELEEVAPGHYKLQSNLIRFRLLNIDKMELSGEDGAFLSAFCKDIGRMQRDFREGKNVDILRKLFRDRLEIIEKKGGKDMKGVDVTDLVMPQIEAARTEGREEGREETARRMKSAGEDTQKISKYTGLSLKEIKKL